ncbi:hypothetical protein [Desulfosarcina ovata]|nr:hypothetical protein [Desulfosarcina ovata]
MEVIIDREKLRSKIDDLFNIANQVMGFVKSQPDGPPDGLDRLEQHLLWGHTLLTGFVYCARPADNEIKRLQQEYFAEGLISEEEFLHDCDHLPPPTMRRASREVPAIST